MNINIAIDGPSGAGKSTISQKLAQRLGYIYIDTGAMYRAVGLYALNQGSDTKQADEVIPLLPAITVEITPTPDGQQVFLNGENVTDKIRTPEASIAASDVSAIPEVRAKLLSLQRETAAKNNVIMDGRDIGTQILPNAQVKIFLTADVTDRAQRRLEQLTLQGVNTTFDDVLKDMQYRDKQDSSREAAPLACAPDAFAVDTTGNTFEQSVEQIYFVITEKLENLQKIHNYKPHWFFKFAKGLLKGFFKLFFRYKVIGAENIPQDEVVIACANHNSLLDPPFLGVTLPDNIGVMAKEELFRIWGFGKLIRKLGAFPIRRGQHDIAAVRTALQVLKAGKSLIIFPEGGRFKSGTEVKGKNGAAMIAVRAKAKILPMGIIGTFKPFRKMWLNIGKPIDLSEFYGKKPETAEYDKITASLLRTIGELKGLKIEN